MNIFFKTLITSKKFQDTAGIIRGSFRILQGFQAYPSKSLLDLENNKFSQPIGTSKPDTEIKKSEKSQIINQVNEKSKSEENLNKSQEIIPLKNKIEKTEGVKETKNDKTVIINQIKNVKIEEKPKLKVESVIKTQEKIKKEEIIPQNSIIESDNMINVQKEGGEGKAFELFTDTKNFTIGSEKPVPAGPWSRAYNFGKLGLSILGGGITEAIKQNLTLSSNSSAAGGGMKRYFLNEANAERISVALCKMRGAPLKLGQVLSIQEDELIPKPIREAFERARKSANIMPKKQLYWMLEKELGGQWRNLFQEFNEIPFAAASIGQVHYAKTKEGAEVAVKVQYPGVMESIESDLGNLKSLMIYTNIFPKTMFLDQLIQNTKIELMEECDYLSEAKKQDTYRNFLINSKGLYVPKIITNLTTGRILTTEFVKGASLDYVALNYSQEKRNSIGERIMLLTLEELFKYKFMQTDPNPANFFYDIGNDLLYLLDFGAARSFSEEFMNKYIQIVYGAAVHNRKLIMDASKDIGFLTGEENKAMKQAHEDSIITVGEPFAYEGEFDFGSQMMTQRIYKLMPIMFKNRLKAPPPEVYSLHRKLSGAFLLNMKLKTKINCNIMFMRLYNEYKFSK